MTEVDLQRFYEMFNDEFFLKPEIYEYSFGSFSIAEIKELDLYIEDVFVACFGIDESLLESTTSNVNMNQSFNDVKNSPANKVALLNLSSIGEDQKSFEENWEDEFCDEIFTMPAPVKVVPIGMTIDNFNGEKFSQREPLLKHFDTFDASSAPVGGIPKPIGKAAYNQNRKCKYRNKKALKSEQDLLHGSGEGRIFAKTSNGEVFILV